MQIKNFSLYSFIALITVGWGIGCSKTGKNFSLYNGSSTGDNAAVPTLIFSSTPTGEAQQSFSSTATVYGRILKSGPGASSCMEKYGSNDGFCQSPGNYTPMPNNEWKYDSSTKEWRATLPPGIFNEGTFKVYWKNSGSNKATFVSIQILEDGKPQILTVEYPYNKPETTFQLYEAVYFQVSNGPKTGSQACSEEVGVTDGRCNMDSSWVNMPANGWKYSDTLQRWEVLIKPGEWRVGTFRFFWKNANTKSVSQPAVLNFIPDGGPILVFSDTPFGPPKTTFKTTDKIYGYVINGDPNSASCLENLSANPGTCSQDSNFVQMPNEHWKFSTTNQRWEVILGPEGSIQLSKETVSLRGFWKNGTTNKKSQGTDLQLVK